MCTLCVSFSASFLECLFTLRQTHHIPEKLAAISHTAQSKPVQVVLSVLSCAQKQSKFLDVGNRPLVSKIDYWKTRLNLGAPISFMSDRRRIDFLFLCLFMVLQPKTSGNSRTTAGCASIQVSGRPVLSRRMKSHDNVCPNDTHQVFQAPLVCLSVAVAVRT